jgi:LysM repeat protein
MATINNIPIFVIDENLTCDTEITQHPTEKGLPLTDSIRVKPKTLSISGKIVDSGSLTARDIISKIENLRTKGSLITYSGRNAVGNFQIQNFNTTYSNSTWGGAEFDMDMVEVRIAKSAYNAPKASTSTAAKKNNPTLKVGSIVVFKGGSVYAASDSKKAAATRGRSTCKITKISTASYSIHQYHLISTDSGKVYGWVDKSNIEGTGNSGTAAKTNGGTQQVQKGKNTAVYHKVKKGDTVWALVNNKYKSLGKSCNWVISNNPKCFSRKGDATTLQIGKKLLMGYK